MMRLETMRTIDDSLDGQTRFIVQDLLSRWGQDIEEVSFFRASANFVFTFTKATKPYFLRFNHENERNVDGIEQELAFVNYLLANGISVAKPVISLNGMFVESVSSNFGAFHGVVFEALIGKQYDLSELSQDQIFQWGKSLGELHQVSTGYKLATRPSWQDHLTWIETRLSKEETAALRVAEEIESSFERLNITEMNYGLIHFDFELDNVIWQQDKISILDFDESCYLWFVADIAFALRDRFDDNPQNVDLSNPSFKAFITGYRSIRSVSDTELSLIPLFLRFHNLFSFSRLIRARENLSLANQPDWLQRLDEKLRNAIIDYRNSFESSLI